MILDETRERFLMAIAKQVDPDRIAEIHFFAPIKQGGVESGVAVIAAAAPQREPESVEMPTNEAAEVAVDGEVEGDLSVAPVIVEESPGAPGEPATPEPIERHVIYTARYRLTLKGPDRGKWETNVTAEADAPIITVDAVVRGVQRRAGDVDDPTRMNGEEVRASLPKAG